MRQFLLCKYCCKSANSADSGAAAFFLNYCWRYYHNFTILILVKGVYNFSWHETHHRTIRSVTCHMRSHSVTCHLTQVNAPRLLNISVSWYSIYLPRRDGKLSWPRLPGNVPAGNRTRDLDHKFDALLLHHRAAWLPWVWEFPWEFPWVCVWDGMGMGMGTVMNSHGNCGNSVGIFEWLWD